MIATFIDTTWTGCRWECRGDRLPADIRAWLGQTSYEAAHVAALLAARGWQVKVATPCRGSSQIERAARAAIAAGGGQ